MICMPFGILASRSANPKPHAAGEIPKWAAAIRDETRRKPRTADAAVSAAETNGVPQ